jgi:hypothetical protein
LHLGCEFHFSRSGDQSFAAEQSARFSGCSAWFTSKEIGRCSRGLAGWSTPAFRSIIVYEGIARLLRCRLRGILFLRSQDEEGRMGSFRAQHHLSHAAETVRGYQTTFGIDETECRFNFSWSERLGWNVVSTHTRRAFLVRRAYR